MLINVLDHLDTAGKPDLQAALDATRHGDAVYMPGWVEYVAPSGGFVVRKSIELFGDGPGDPSAGTGTLLTASSSSGPVLKIDAQPLGLPNLQLHDFRIEGGGEGIRAQTHAGNPPQKVSETTFERIHVSGTTGDGFHLEGQSSVPDANLVGIRFLDCVAEDCGGRGMYLQRVAQALVMHCRFKGSGGAGVWGENSGVVLCQCTLDGNDTTASEGNLVLTDCRLARVDACRIVNFGAGLAKGCVLIGCGGKGSVGNCFFELPSVAGVGIEVTGTPTDGGPVVIFPNRFRRVQTMVKVGANPAGCVVMPQFDDAPIGSGSMDLPGTPNAGLVAVPSINRVNGNRITGIVLPSAVPSIGGSGDPSLNLLAGTLAFNSVTSSVRAYESGAPPLPHDVALTLARITDLTVDAQGRHSLRLRWTSLGGTSYTLMRSIYEINEGNPGEEVEGLPAPGPIGTYECFVDFNEGAGLDQCTDYFYALKYTNGSEAPMSNVAAGMTLCAGFFEVECP